MSSESSPNWFAVGGTPAPQNLGGIWPGWELAGAAALAAGALLGSVGPCPKPWTGIWPEAYPGCPGFGLGLA